LKIFSDYFYVGLTGIVCLKNKCKSKILVESKLFLALSWGHRNRF
jgi:hypothetical protein